MAATTHTYVRIAPRPRSDGAGVTGERPSRNAVRPQDRDWPTDTRVWNWTESAALWGYGPSPSAFL
ncbi:MULTISPECIES: hypothetical protein [Streptomyces]|uniref:Uncharacterized protein n=1 Tax=Streptomyces sviceus (strain ATCC 29083 / DSM 924 / JCM 4929 / NBRC 13980 / NCIMB 11184 / NRRL 5439 / UC 5370) TaxID=463191 RepID=B5I657_STRX2|nr:MULTISPECIES: hypothetical protein [Streptomyces]EDY60562.1 conserved hypothetical protein [Streptomyces sviceus ATCC 29083]MYT03467.1 hypothetical protein [Streptomyces sp. SID5470]